ncbi:putative bifunctional diguanylate cyclase/phosphodiesterase [Pseudooceanicola sp.]|uniref:putative bifunctional diguanylate cyclase/phosphodiesterase n=1 Tax=Pseudooceanicola sp. TaxID=1914328 RepID=UPI0035C78568
MTVPLPPDGTFETDAATKALELRMAALRDAALAATSACAGLILLTTAENGPGHPLIALSADGPVDRALRDFCFAKDETGTDQTGAPPCKTGQITVEGVDYHLMALPLAGPTAAARGWFALAIEAPSNGLQQIIETCSHFARVAELTWDTHDGMENLAYEVVTLSSRAARLQRIAEIDPLTQLENSASFEDKVRRHLEDTPSEMAFVVLDIDHFKLINDLYGHQFGDIYLKTIARSLRTAFPEGSIIGRLGGDEFGVLTPVPAASRPYLEGLLTRCRSSIQRATALQGKPDLGKVSIGASQFPDHGTDYAVLYEHADAALYAAKASGRSVSAVFEPHHHARYNGTEFGNRFHAAVERGDIRPYFQPQVDVTDGKCLGFEILARWRRKSGHLLEPGDFAAIFRDHALAEKMTRTVMHSAFRIYARTIAPTGLPLRLALNVTFFDLMNPEFAFEVQQAVADTGFDWSLLTIEVTEQTMLGEPNGQVFRSLNELRRRGARVALDDFGTGYGGLRHLAAWPIDAIKIDKYFVDGLTSGPRDRAVFEALTGMCHRLGYSVVAEGIETSQQIAALRKHGCRFAQGYYFDRPLAEDELGSFRPRYDLP